MANIFSRATTGTEVAKLFSSKITGKTIIVTGVSPRGIGAKLVDILIDHKPKTIVIASRTMSKVAAIIDQLKARAPSTTYVAVSLDLGSQKSVRAAASAILSNPIIEQIDYLFNNGAIMNPPERELSPEGIELQFATNHIGPFLFTNLLMPKIIAAAKKSPHGAVRIINVSSRAVAYSPVRFSDINFDQPFNTLPAEEQPNLAALQETGRSVDPTERYNPPVAYGQSKVAVVLFALELTKKLYERHGILSYALHPGAVSHTELSRTMDKEKLEELYAKFAHLFINTDQGTSTMLVAALDDRMKAAPDGKGIYLADAQVTDAPLYAQDPAIAEKLWALDEKLVGEKFEY